MIPPIALQLYTVRDAMNQDLTGTLAQLARIGYRNVELAGLYKRTAAEVRKLLDDAGLKAVAAHVGIDQLKTQPEQAIADARTLGYDVIVCPWLAESMRTAEGYAATAGVLRQVAGRADAKGLSIGYHNHDFEFAVLPDGRTGMDVLFEGGQGSAPVAELDTCWAHAAGHDPVAWMKKLSGRLPLVHIKDFSAQRKLTEVGTGTVNIQAIVNAAGGCGVKYLVIEQDNNWAGSPVESAKVSYENLRKIIG